MYWLRSSVLVRLSVPTLLMPLVRTGSWMGPPREGRAPRVRISPSYWLRSSVRVQMSVPTLLMPLVRTGSWTGLPRGERASRVGISPSYWLRPSVPIRLSVPILLMPLVRTRSRTDPPRGERAPRVRISLSYWLRSSFLVQLSIPTPWRLLGAAGKNDGLPYECGLWLCIFWLTIAAIEPWELPPAPRARPNCLGLYRRSPESGDLWYKSRQ